MKWGELGIWVVGFAIAVGIAAGCTDTHPTPGDKNTNWLKSCEASSECGGGLDCIADVCTRACDSIEDCRDPELALQCAAGVCAMSTSTPMAGSSAPAPDASMPTPDASMATPDGGEPMACGTGDANRKPGADRYDTTATGPRACSGTTLAEVIAAIHAAYPDLSDIVYVYNPDSPPPPIALSNMIKAFAIPDGFAIAMRRGAGDCESGCIDNEYWYFRTDASCDPHQVGHYRPQPNDAATCMMEGYPMWDEPVPPSEFPPACGELVRTSYLRDEYTVNGCGTSLECSGPGANNVPRSVVLELQVKIDKSDADPSTGTVTLQGTGLDLIDGRPLQATFEGAAVQVSAHESLPSTCLEQYNLELLLDFDGNREGYLRYEDARTPNCTTGGELCKGSLQLDFGRAVSNASCLDEQDISTALESARVPLLDCESDDDCTTLSLETCLGGCSAAVRADKAAELNAAVEQVHTAYCPGADGLCVINTDCPAVRAACTEGKCTAVPE